MGDRVGMWATLNEPWVVTDAGYLHGVHAPGHRSLVEAPVASYHLLRAHAEAVRAYRAEGRHRIGIVVNLEPKDAASDRPEDLAAAARTDAYMNRQYLDPLFLGRFPDELRDIFGEAWPEHRASDVESLREPMDFLGVNYYTRGVMRHDPANLPERASRVKVDGSAYTDIGWEVHPPGLFRCLAWVRERYGDLPLYVTENGAAFPDPPHPRGPVHDPQRVDYLRRHLLAARDAIRAGIDLRGYFVWSLLDNFEWGEGYSKRFGIVHVDYSTRRRAPKDSARFYSDVIRTRGAVLDDPSTG